MRSKLPEVMAALQWVEREESSRCGVYMLMLKGEVQYIGKSWDVDRRVACHRKSQRIRFDAVRFAQVRHAYLARVERELLLAHVPLKNALFPGTDIGIELNRKLKHRRKTPVYWWERVAALPKRQPTTPELSSPQNQNQTHK